MRKSVGLLVALAAAVALVVFALSRSRIERTAGPPSADAGPDTRVAARPFVQPTASESRASMKGPTVVGDGGVCAEGVSLECDGGDVWSFDSCGRREARVTDCGDRVCDHGRCLEPKPGPSCASARVSETGRCDGDVLRYCEHGIARTVECAARGLRCGRDALGEPNCVDPHARPPAPASPCGECPRGFACVVVEGARPRCERRMTASEVRADRCAGCECSRSEVQGPEVCDGLDNDGDGVIDNNVRCPAIEAVAFLVAGSDGRTVESEERVREDFRQNRELFLAPTLVLRDVRVIVRPAWVDANSEVLDGAMRTDPELHRRDEPPFVPVIYTRTVAVGAKDVAGVGALPNGQCARMGPLPPFVDDHGFVVLARQRRATSLAHEIGHYLGLCHTHQRDRDVAAAVVVTDEGNVECRECARTGDGVCDTPVDPGLDDGCVADAESCAVTCASGDRPAADNLMSYYPCRESFTDRQVVLMRQWWWLRRARPGAVAR